MKQVNRSSWFWSAIILGCYRHIRQVSIYVVFADDADLLNSLRAWRVSNCCRKPICGWHKWRRNFPRGISLLQLSISREFQYLLLDILRHCNHRRKYWLVVMYVFVMSYIIVHHSDIAVASAANAAL